MSDIAISYVRAKFFRRIMANLVDLLIFVLVFLCLFLGVREIVKNTDEYKVQEAKMTEIMLDSGLYVNDNGQIKDVISYINGQTSFSASKKRDDAIKVIDNFFIYAESVLSQEDVQSMKEEYYTFLLSDSLSYEGQNYFIESNGEVIENPDCDATYFSYYQNAYAVFIDNYLHSYLNVMIPGYYDAAHYMSNMLFFVELPIAYLVGGFLVYFIPPLIFRRGRKTLGKALYKIGLVDGNYLSPSFKRFLARFSIFYFGILILSLFTFAVPAIISVTLMGFSRKKQGFTDYLLNLQEVDTTHNKIYLSYEEISLTEAETSKKPVDFQMINRL